MSDNSSKKPDPLWLPVGSVRALIALSVVGTMMYMAATQSAVEDWAVMAFTLVVTSYFEGRRAINSSKPPDNV